MLAKQLTFASRCPSAPMTIGHASTTIVSLQSVPLVTGVGYCGSNGSTRPTSLTICRSIGRWTTDDACNLEGTVTIFPVATMNAHAIQCKLNGMQLFTSSTTASKCLEAWECWPGCNVCKVSWRRWMTCSGCRLPDWQGTPSLYDLCCRCGVLVHVLDF